MRTYVESPPQVVVGSPGHGKLQNDWFSFCTPEATESPQKHPLIRAAGQKLVNIRLLNNRLQRCVYRPSKSEALLQPGVSVSFPPAKKRTERRRVLGIRSVITAREDWGVGIVGIASLIGDIRFILWRPGQTGTFRSHEARDDQYPEENVKADHFEAVGMDDELISQFHARMAGLIFRFMA